MSSRMRRVNLLMLFFNYADSATTGALALSAKSVKRFIELRKILIVRNSRSWRVYFFSFFFLFSHLPFPSVEVETIFPPPGHPTTSLHDFDRKFDKIAIYLIPRNYENYEKTKFSFRQNFYGDKVCVSV